MSTWARIIEHDVLELRDPNSGQNLDPETKPRHQYRIEYWLLLRRVLPPASVGDRWADDNADEPWWEPVLELPRSGPVLEYWLERGGRVASQHEYTWQARSAAGHIALYTPNGREVRIVDGGYQVQPHNDNYWIRCRTLPEARRAFFGGER